MKLIQRLVTAGICFSVLCVCGCGGSSGPKLPDGPKGTAKAKVMYEGKAITVGTLTLDSGKGYVASATAGSDGSFPLKGPTGDEIPAGMYRVGVAPPPSPPPAKGATEMPPPPKIEGLPEKFYTPGSSGVEVEIKAGKQDVTIELK